LDNPITLDEIREILREVYDIERLSSKIATGNCTARDMAALRQSISQLTSTEIYFRQYRA